MHYPVAVRAKWDEVFFRVNTIVARKLGDWCRVMQIDDP